MVQLPVVLIMQPPHVVHTMAPRPFNDLRYAYHNGGSNNDNQDEWEELIEVKKKYQTLEKRVKDI